MDLMYKMNYKIDSCTFASEMIWFEIMNETLLCQPIKLCVRSMDGRRQNSIVLLELQQVLQEILLSSYFVEDISFTHPKHAIRLCT
jgi:hypothetical protein